MTNSEIRYIIIIDNVKRVQRTAPRRIRFPSTQQRLIVRSLGFKAKINHCLNKKEKKKDRKKKKRAASEHSYIKL